MRVWSKNLQCTLGIMGEKKGSPPKLMPAISLQNELGLQTWVHMNSRNCGHISGKDNLPPMYCLAGRASSSENFQVNF